jgi:putative hemolysin
MAHIVDLLIQERAPNLLRGRLTGWLMREVLFPSLGYHEAKAAIDQVQAMSGPGIMAFAAQQADMRVRILGGSRLPPEGRVLIAANHPTGLADGVALWRGLSPIREDLKILANGDALRIAPGLADVFIPVEWTRSRRNPAGSRRVLADLARAMRAEEALVFFPSGRLAYLHWRGLKERPWLPTVVTLARKFAAPIYPLHIRSRNSWLFYALSQLSQELRDVTLFRELLNKQGRLFELTVGLPIDAADLPDDPVDAIQVLQHHVEVELPRASRADPRIHRRLRGRVARLDAPLR